MKRLAWETAVGIETTKPAQPETSTHTAIPSVTAEANIPAELTFREDSEKPKVQTAVQTDGKEPVQQVVSDIKEPAPKSASVIKEPMPHTAARKEAVTAAQTKPGAATYAVIPTAHEEKGKSAEPTYREEPYRPAVETAVPHDIKEPAPKSAVGMETAKVVQGETATREAIPSVHPETDIPSVLTYRQEPEQQAFQTAEQRDAKTIAPQSAVRTETTEAAQPSIETAASIAIPSADPETDIPAELTYREAEEGNVQRGTEGTIVPGSEPAERTAAVRTQAAAQPEAATHEAIPSVDPETDEPAELAYRQEPEQITTETAAQHDTKQSEPQKTVRTEAAEDAYAETVIREAIPSVDQETDIPAELTFIEEPERNAGHSASRQTVGTTQSRPQAQQSGETVRAERAARQTVRDIRMTSEQGRRHPDAARSGRQTEEQALQDAQKPQDADSIALPVEDAMDAPRQPELFFAVPTVGGQPPEDPTAAASEKVSQSDKTSALPTWAKELLEKSGVSSIEQQSAAFNWDSGSSHSKQVNWTAPMAISQQSAPNGMTELTFKEPREAETPARRMIDDAEIQRTADKVYKIIEERLRRELRRSGR